jgi:plasmid maintenance system killer protein
MKLVISLKTHKLKGNRAKEYAIWIEGDLRITFVL